MKSSKPSGVTFKRLDRLSPDDEASFQRILESAPAYTERVTGQLTCPGSQARENLDALPPGKNFDDKFVFAIHWDGAEEPIGCIDWIRGYPSPSVVMLGLLMLSEKYHDKGLGRLVYDEFERYLLAWRGIKKIRLATVSTNGRIYEYWEKMGFHLTGELRPYECKEFRAENLVMEKHLDKT